MRECWFDLVLKVKSLQVRYSRGFLSKIWKLSVAFTFFLFKIKTNIEFFFQVSFLTPGTWFFDLHISKHLHYIHEMKAHPQWDDIFFWRSIPILMHLYFHITAATVLNPALLNTLPLDRIWSFILVRILEKFKYNLQLKWLIIICWL